MKILQVRGTEPSVIRRSFLAMNLRNSLPVEFRETFINKQNTTEYSQGRSCPCEQMNLDDALSI